MREYLLGTLGDAERQTLEDEMTSNEAEFSRLLEIEDELVQDYADGRLSPEEAQRFDSAFLATPERRNKLRFAQAFRTFVNRDQSDVSHRSPRRRPAERPRLLDWFRVPLPALAAAFSLLLAASLFWSVIQLREVRSELARSRQAQTDLASREAEVRKELDVQRGDALRLSRELERLQSDRSALEKKLADLQIRSATPTLAAFLLSPGLLRSESRTNLIRLPSGDSLVVLFLDIGLDDYRSYQAVVSTADGAELVTQNRLAAGPFEKTVAVKLTLPGTVLSEGDYLVKLTGTGAHGEAKPLLNYAFRVIRGPLR